jgi:hypothetical protein
MKIEEKSQYSVGDFVKIVSSGCTYSTYDRMFKKMGFNNTKSNESWDDGDVGQIFAIDNHPDFGGFIYALVDKDGRECLMSEAGINKFVIKRIKPINSINIILNSSYTAEITKEEKVIVGCQTFDFDTITKLWDAVCEMRLKIAQK